MAATVRRMTFSTTNIFKSFTNNKFDRTESNPEGFTEVEANEFNRRTFSDPGSGYVPDVYSKTIEQDLDNLVTENDDPTSVSPTTGFSRITTVIRINRSHWKDTSKFNHCKRCAKPFGFAGRKFNCRR